MATNPRKLKPAELLRLVNSTPLGEVIGSSSFYRLRQRAGLNVSGDGKTIHLLKFARWLISQVPPPAAGETADKPKKSIDAGQAHRDRMAAASRKRTSATSDIGDIPPIVNLERREACRHDLGLFCQTYNPEAFKLEWADYHREAILRLEESILRGALFAFAIPRGGGKTTLCRMAVLWAASYAHSRYAYYIGATIDKGKKGLDAIKVWMRFLPEYIQDFPEIAMPVCALEGRAQRAQSQHCGGEPTLIEWRQDSITLPTVPPPPNLKHDGPLTPTSGIVIGASGLTAEGIRGSLHATSTGELVRPDLVVLDDPQTDESARSEDQNTKRLELIHGAILGMAGPGKSIAAVMPCTVIAPGDMVDQTLDREKHPLWRGSRTKMLDVTGDWPPSNLDAWEKYFDIYDYCVQLEPPDFTDANEYYRKHRKELDAGLRATWSDRVEWELSPVQHAMNLYHRDPVVFMAEYMNTPVDPHADERPLEAADLLKRRNGYVRSQVPLDTERVTAYIDVHGELLFWIVVGWDDRFGGHVLDYGAWPEQSRRRFILADTTKTLSKTYPGKDLGGRLYEGMQGLVGELMSQKFRRDDGSDLSIERCVIDANWGQSTDVVYQFCRQSEYTDRLTPGHGKYYGAKGRAFGEQKKKTGERRGLHWFMPSLRDTKRPCRYVVIDTNFWKSFVAERLRIGEGDRGAIQFFGKRNKTDDRLHELFVEHLTAERCVKVTANGRTVDEWLSPDRNRDNHWWDCLVGSAVAANMCGVSSAEHHQSHPQRRKRKTVSVSKAQKSG